MVKCVHNSKLRQVARQYRSPSWDAERSSSESRNGKRNSHVWTYLERLTISKRLYSGILWCHVHFQMNHSMIVVRVYIHGKIIETFRPQYFTKTPKPNETPYLIVGSEINRPFTSKVRVSNLTTEDYFRTKQQPICRDPERFATTPYFMVACSFWWYSMTKMLHAYKTWENQG